MFLGYICSLHTYDVGGDMYGTSLTFAYMMIIVTVTSNFVDSHPTKSNKLSQYLVDHPTRCIRKEYYRSRATELHPSISM